MGRTERARSSGCVASYVEVARADRLQTRDRRFQEREMKFRAFRERKGKGDR